jgi:hypothetical protein
MRQPKLNGILIRRRMEKPIAAFFQDAIHKPRGG